MTASNRKTLWKRRLSRTALVCALALACASGPALAANDDDEEDSFETKIIKGILGINDKDSIDYRERPPLVVPPSRDLPSPETTATVSNPAWPKDPDVQEKKRKKAAAKQPRKSFEEEGRALTPAELNVGRRASAGRREPGSATNDYDQSRPLRPNEMGYKGGVFDTLFKDTSKGETATFTGEPPRASLTQPPPGYLTPSPSYPYGLSAKKEASKSYNAYENRGSDYDR